MKGRVIMNLKLKEAVDLRNRGCYEESRSILIQLTKTSADPNVFYHCAGTLDVMELEREAIFFYEKALSLGLEGESVRGCYIGLGSTYRSIGEYQKAIDTLEKGLSLFPDEDVMKVFLAMAKYNNQDYNEAMKILLNLTLKHNNIKDYSKAIAYYSDKLDDIWD
jgi:tetratricopeptide (TPR) repeat protein